MRAATFRHLVASSRLGLARAGLRAILVRAALARAVLAGALVLTSLAVGCPTEVARCNVDAECGAAEVCLDGTCQERACPTYYRDADGDGAGDRDEGQVLCDALEGFVVGNDDCDDSDAAAFPGAPEVTADGVDQDCDGADGCFVDGDGDGVGSPAVASAAGVLDCDAVPNLSSRDDDCDDADALRSPTNPEIPNDGTDGDCDGGEVCFADVDVDGFGGDGTVPSADFDCADDGEIAIGGDCDDEDADVNRDASEITADGVDQDCDGVDRCFEDLDGDDHGTAVEVSAIALSCDGPGTSFLADDCDDANADANPDAPEQAGSGVDEDCDGLELCFVDADSDGFGGANTALEATLTCNVVQRSSAGGDCDDANDSVNPNDAEIVADFIDQDCDLVDACFRDGDGDSFGSTTIVDGDDLDCADGPLTSATNDDCNDASAGVRPNAAEIVANGSDDNCDGSELCFVDVDGDDFGATATTTSTNAQCAAEGVAPNDDDCNDATSAIRPGAAETGANGVDEDCDGVDSCFVDADNDNFGGDALVDGDDLDCAVGPGAANSDDCNDGNAAVRPGGAEAVADGIDGNCDGDELCFVDVDRDGFGFSGATLTVDGLDCNVLGASSNADDCDDAVVGGPGLACDDAQVCTVGDVCGNGGVCTGFNDGTCLGCSTAAASCAAGGCCDVACTGGNCPDCVGTDCRQNCGVAGSSCSASCTAGAACAVRGTAGTSANVDCSDSTCNVTAGAGSSLDIGCTDSVCLLDSSSGNSIDLLCVGSFCDGDLTAGTSIAVECADSSTCDVLCDADNSCDLTCDASSECVFQCIAGNSCTVRCPGGTEQSCGGGVSVCNRPCPT